jgi:predicted GNAT family N-acyltransferase
VVIINGELADWCESVKANIGLDAFNVWENKDRVIVLSTILVSTQNRSVGKGTAAMWELVRYLDDNHKSGTLSAAVKNKEMGTTSKARLVSFYQRFGFVQNKGKLMRIDMSGTMYRLPNLSKDLQIF